MSNPKNELRQRKNNKNSSPTPASEQGSNTTTLLVQEDTPLMPREDDDEDECITSSSFRVTPLIQRSSWLRMDVGPFAMLYLILIAADYQCDAAMSSSSSSSFLTSNGSEEAMLPAGLSMDTVRTTITVAFAVTLLSHAAIALMTQWSVAWKVAVGYRSLSLDIGKSADPESEMSRWTHAHVQSLHSSSSSSSSSGTVMSGIAQVRLETRHSINKNDNKPTYCAVVDFHHHKFRFCPNSEPDGDSRLFQQDNSNSRIDTTKPKETRRFKLSFKPIRYPTNLPLSLYRRWNGHASNAHVILAQQVYGLNETILELPTFAELIGEQLMAPFFLFQVFCVVLWSLDEYWYYAMFTLCALLMFESTLAYNRKQSLQRLHQRASSSTGGRFWALRPTLDGLTLSTAKNDKKRPKAGVWMRLPKSELLPGDIVSLCVTSTEGLSVPADMVMLQGSAVCDEALLTGESVPQLKQALDTADGGTPSKQKEQHLDLQDPLHKESILFAGTKLLVANSSSTDNSDDISKDSLQPNPPDGGAVGMVLRTSFETVQGNLLRTMAYSALGGGNNNNVHSWDTFIFILMLICCAIIAAAMVLEAGWQDERRNRFRLVLHVIIIVTSVVPPELPMELSLAVTNSVAALVRTCRVYCSELNRIPWAGEVNVCCFDKTGTLTSDEMRLRGVRVATSLYQDYGDDDGKAEERRLLMPDEDDIPRETLRVMIGCHSLTPTRNTSMDGIPGIAVVGDPLEQAVLKTSGYRLVGNNLVASIEEEGGGKALTILHRFAFSSKLKRMTVLVTEEGAKGKMWALSKGAPETLKSKMLEDSIPEDYDMIAHHHMCHGRRVLAMASRSLGTIASLQGYKEKGRDHVETKLSFVGFLVLDCPIKPDSKSIITELNLTGHDTVMITGDAILTAVEVARQVAILPPSSSPETVYRIQQKSNSTASENDVAVEFECVEVSPVIDDSKLSVLPFSRADITKLGKLRRGKSARFCIDGDTLICMAKAIASSNLKLQGLSTTNTEDEKSFLLQPQTLSFLRELVPLISVFARHAPHQKEAVVAAFNHGAHRTLMVGDGTNDVGALKRAHVGISIISAPEVEAKQRDASETLTKMKKKTKKGKKTKNRRQVFEQTLQQLREAQEELDQVELGDASVAAPFTSRAVSIKCVKDVIQQGRCTLVTMLQIYKILGINCLVNAMVLSNLFLHGVKQGDQQLTILGIAVAALFYFVTRAEPLPNLSVERPPSSVLCASALISIALQFGVHLTTIALATQASLVFVDPYDVSLVPDGPFNPNVLNSCTFMLTCVATINTFAVNYRGKPFMQELRANKLMYRSLQLCYAVLAICALEVFPPLNDLMQLTTLPDVVDRIVEPAGPLSSLLIQVAEQIGFPFFIFWLMVLDTLLAFLAEKVARKFF